MKRPNPPQIPKIHPDKKSSANNVALGNKTPITAIGAAIAIITHYKIMPRWNRANYSLAVITAMLTTWKIVGTYDKCRCARGIENGVGVTVQRLLKLLLITRGFFIKI